MSNDPSYPIKSALLGLITGDALGVPHEFQFRDHFRNNPVTQMTGCGTHNQPPGTWSDDSSLTLCLADELAKGYDLQSIANSFVQWMYEGHWTPHGEVFDIGNATAEAIRRLRAGTNPVNAGNRDEGANGNGALMRILPLLWEVRVLEDPMERFQTVRDVAAITHGHIRSALACFFYLEMGRLVLNGYNLFDAYFSGMVETQYFASLPTKPKTVNYDIITHESSHFHRLFAGNIHRLPEHEIQSTVYVIHTLEASVWCLLTTGNYRDAVLKAVNLGDDTDTTAAVTGGLAGLYYGMESIPRVWLDQITRLDDILDVCQKMAAR